jgi:ligand-binding sensor domain-containing protein
LFSEASCGQAFRFRNYKTENGLPSGVIYSLNQDNDGYLWVGTPEGLSRFDGFEFYKVQFPDSSAGRYPTVSMKDKNGILWFGCNDGSLFYTDGRSLKPVTLSNSSGTGISSILEGPDGYIYVLPQRKPVYKIDPKKPAEAEIITFRPDPGMFSATFTDSGEMLVGTQENLIICKVAGDSLTAVGAVEGFDYSSITAINRINNNTFIIGTDGNGIFHLKMDGETKVLSRLKGYPGLETLQVKSVIHDSQSNLWVSASGTGAVKMQFLNKTGFSSVSG